MNFSAISNIYEKIESTSKRLEMTDLLVDLLKNTPIEIIDKVVYLTQGKLYPDFIDSEIGIAEKLALKALVKISGVKATELKKDLNKTGDIGKTAENCLANKKQVTFFHKPLTVRKVYETLDKIARASGAGAIDLKIALLAGVLASASLREAKYIMRTVTGNLRLGIADMTVLDALAIAYGGGKESRGYIERAYNISSDLGVVAKTVAEKGLEGIKQFHVLVGQPIRPMLAERLSSPEEILEKLGGKCSAEYKYDGERIQIHKNGEKVFLFSRRLENISKQYPDVIKLVQKFVNANSAILDAECVAIDDETGEMRPFQDLMHRRRKYRIKQVMAEYPISLFIFDTLYVDGKDLTLKSYLHRRKILMQIIRESERVKTAKCMVTKTSEALESFFLTALEAGGEGLICKSIASHSFYQAGARGWLWIKYKRDYKSEMTDTVDLVIVGAFHGRGKRAGMYGALLLAAYNNEKDTFETVTKCGTGFTDEDITKFPDILEKYIVPHKPPRVTSTLKADVWFEPSIVIEILGAEITLSPVHTCAKNAIRQGSGFAIRFPRFTGNYRTDKTPEDATTVSEIVEFYQHQLKRIG